LVYTISSTHTCVCDGGKDRGTSTHPSWDTHHIKSAHTSITQQLTPPCVCVPSDLMGVQAGGVVCVVVLARAPKASKQPPHQTKPNTRIHLGPPFPNPYQTHCPTQTNPCSSPSHTHRRNHTDMAGRALVSRLQKQALPAVRRPAGARSLSSW
jgi:hypothetical protein